MPVANANSYLNLDSYAFQVNKHHKRNHRTINVLCGDNPPTIVDGYGKWTVIDRPLRQGITIPTGFNPAKLKVEARFGIWNDQFDGILSDGTKHGRGWDTRAVAADQVEHDIDNLHWMAGGNAPSGPSPTVYLSTYRLIGKRQVSTRLVPWRYWGVSWVIDGGIEWGKSLRHRNGDRIYQDATFQLLGYTVVPGGGASAPKKDHSTGGGFFKVNATHRTARQIAAANSGRVPEVQIDSLARRILREKRNNPIHRTRIFLERRSINWPIPIGKDVWVPGHHI